jgi:hypothetical protein
MGRSFLFQCPRCHYRTVVVGGADRGFNCFVQTIVCRDCSALFDAVVRLRVAARDVRRPHFLWPQRLKPQAEPRHERQGSIAWHNRLLFAVKGKSKWVKLKLRCPVSQTHKIEPWREPGQCPRCRTHLERTLTPYRIWD